MSDAAIVTTEVELRRLAPRGQDPFVLAHLRYSSADPWAVRLVFRHRGCDGVEWVFGRDLLADGRQAPAGDGSVRVRPGVGGHRPVVLELRSGSADASFELDRDDLQEFLSQTLLLVPAGAEIEVVDLDSELAMLLTSEH